MKSIKSNIKNSMNSVIQFIHEGVIVEDDQSIEKKVFNRDYLIENSFEPSGDTQRKNQNSDSTEKNHESCCRHFF